MVQFNTKDNEILVKIVYYGTGLSGKTTNLQKLHEMTDPTQKTDLFSVNTMQDRTLFFDLLPLDLGYVYGNSIKLQIYTVPGQVHYDSTRRIVLSGADGVAFVADSDQAKLQENIQAINNLYHNLQANRLNIKEIPLVMQYNKRDLANVTPIETLNQKLNFRTVPYFEAVAVSGEGVLETFLETVKQTVRYIFNKYQLSKNIKNVDSVIEKLEASIMANAKKVEAAKAEAVPPSAGKTVLKYTHEFVDPNDQASKDQLLQNAITSNMETAQLYTSLKKSKAALQKKQEELQSLNRQLEKSNSDNLKMRRFLESLVNFAGEAIITFNDLWVIQNWNQAAEELFGYKREQILNKNVNVLFPKDAMSDLNRVLSYVMNGKVVRGFETTLKTRDSSVIPVNITFSPIKNQNETIIAFTAIVRDLSFMAKLSQQLHSVQRFETVGAILPGLIDRTRALTPSLDPGINLMLEEAKHIVLGSTGQAATDLNQLVGLAKQLLDPRLITEAVAWQAQLFPSLPSVMRNRSNVLRALLNLYLNAIDSLVGRPRGKITSGTHFSGGEVLLQIIDNGSGMSSDEMDRVFEPLVDEKKNLRGVRLNTAKELVRLEGGSVRVDSAPGKGTKVTVRFTTS